MRLKVIDYDVMRVAFDEKFKQTYQLIQNGETHLDNLAEGFREADGVIFALPTIEAEPVKHGRWIVKNGRIVCDQCEALWAICPNKDVQEEYMKLVYKTEKFCYNCGAKMDGGAE